MITPPSFCWDTRVKRQRSKSEKSLKKKNSATLKAAEFLIFLASQEGIEPPTNGLEEIWYNAEKAYSKGKFSSPLCKKRHFFYPITVKLRSNFNIPQGYLSLECHLTLDCQISTDFSVMAATFTIQSKKHIEDYGTGFQKYFQKVFVHFHIITHLKFCMRSGQRRLTRKKFFGETTFA